MAKNWLTKLNNLEGAVIDDYNPYNHVLQSPSPSLNFTFGRGHGLPFGYTAIFFGPPGGGKSVVANSMIGQLHSDDPEAIAVKFNTEFREKIQLTPEQMKLMGIDRERYVPYETNDPVLIFDRINNDINAMCQEGAPIKLIIIDSINSIVGRRTMNADSLGVQQIGDLAATLQDGLKQILSTIRNNKIAVILTAHIRAEMDQQEIKRHNTVKMGAGYGVKHNAEYFVYIEQNRNKDGRTDLMGNEFVDDSCRDINDNSEKTGHKIRVCMKKSSVGVAGRVGEFTFNYNKGIINTHEEVFLLGANRGIIERVNNMTYAFKDKKWTGKQSVLEAIRTDTDLQKAILSELKQREASGAFAAEDVDAEDA